MKIYNKNLGLWCIFTSIAIIIVNIIPSGCPKSTSSFLERFKINSAKRSIEVAPAPPQKPSYVWTEWLNCPHFSFVSAMSLSIKRKAALKGITLSCLSLHSREQTRYNLTSTILTNNNSSISNESETKLGTWSSLGYCKNGGLAVGYQLKEASNLKNGNLFNLYEAASNSGNKGIIDLMIYCYDLDTPSRIVANNLNSIVQPAKWLKPIMCGWGEFICTFKLQYGNNELDSVTNVKMKCCPLIEPNKAWRDYREVPGKVLSSESILKSEFDRVYDNHFTDVLDFPYYFEWKFCPTTTYVTGFQLQFVARDLLMLCSDMRRPEPRMPEIIRMDSNKKGSQEENDVSEEKHCEGVAIGIQVKYQNETGIQAVRFFCSFSQNETQIPFIEGRFPVEESLNETLGEWQKPQLCTRNQAVCGFKGHTQGPYFEHLKVKCCHVPDISQVCFPTDRYELVVECDSTEALAETSCSYTLSEGLSITHSTNEGDKRDEQFHNSIAQEWSINEGENDRISDGISQGLTISESTGSSRTLSNTNGLSSSKMNSVTNGNSLSAGRTSTNSKGSSKGNINTISESSSIDETRGKSSSSGTSLTKGESFSNSIGRTDGVSENNQVVSSRDDSVGVSYTKSAAISQGYMSANTNGYSTSQTQGATSSSSRSRTLGMSNSNSHSTSNSETEGSDHTFEAGIGITIKKIIGINLGYNYRNSHSNTKNVGSESTASRQNSDTRDESIQRNNQFTSDLSNSNTNQETRESSFTSGVSTNTDTRIGSSKTQGKEINKQLTSNQNSETNSQQSQTSQSEISSSITNRKGSDISKQSNSQTNEENSSSNNLQQTLDNSKTDQETANTEQSNSTSTSQNSEKSFSKNLQKNIDKSKEVTRTKTRGKNANEGRQFTTGYDWSRSSSQTFNPQKSISVTMTVPAGMRTRLYQAVGHCAYYTVQTTKYKRVDEILKEVDEQVREITSGTEEAIGDDAVVETAFLNSDN